MSKIIGIDLGTTNSCVSMVEGGKPVIIPNDRGGRTTPSVVAFTANGERLVGEAAQRQAAINSDRTIHSVKRHMGTDWRFDSNGKRFNAQEISAMILRKLRADAEAYLGESVTDAVITVPAYFNDVQRQATKDAGRIAGLNVQRIINEPTSAALAYGLDNGAAQKVMVYDLGGGTFDVSIIEIGDGVIEVLATNGDNHLGGDDFVDRTAIPVQNALNDAGLAPSELGRVLLVGGSTRIPAVQEKVRALTGITPSKSINPDECVAQGAAVQGDTLSGGGLQLGGSGTSILLLDVTPLSLSIETVGGVATRLVERNSTLPIHYSKVFSTAAPFQTSVEIHVLQGERAMAKDNKTIGRFRLNGIKRAMAGAPQIEVTFDIDTNGILKVSAKDLDTGKQQSITITENERMSDDEIEQAIRDAEQYAAQDGLRRSLWEAQSEANQTIALTEQALHKVGKQLEKDEKKQIKSEVAELRKKASKLRADKLTEQELSELRAATERLKASGADASKRTDRPKHSVRSRGAT